MDNNSLDNYENNKNIEDVDTNAKKLAALLLPKMVNQPKNKSNYNEIEKKFYKTTGKSFYQNKINKNKKIFKDKLYSANQPRVFQNDITQKYYTSNNFFKSNKNDNNDNNIIKLLQQKINEIENELEHNENTLIHNKKVMQKRLEEKEQEIKKLTKKLAENNEDIKKVNE